MMASGEMIHKWGEESKFGQKDQVMTGSTSMGRNKEWGNIDGLTVQFILENGTTMILMGQVITNGLMGNHITVNG
jgi:hypothetical protein